LTSILIALTITLTLTLAATAASYPTSKAARAWKAPAGWLKQAACIHRHESAGLGWHLAYRDWRGSPSPYSGGMQFLRSTWERAGGTGHAYQWSPLEQQYRAYRIWDMQDGKLRNGVGDWSEWGTARACELR
jgi:hypothetical protein